MTESKFIEYGLLPPYKYELKADAYFDTGCCPEKTIDGQLCTLYPDGWLHVHKGFPWDGATWAPDSDDIMRSSLPHDALLRLRQDGYPVPKDWKQKADSLLNRLCREDGGGKIKRFIARNGVRKFGLARPRDLNKYREVLVAP